MELALDRLVPVAYGCELCHSSKHHVSSGLKRISNVNKANMWFWHELEVYINSFANQYITSNDMHDNLT